MISLDSLLDGRYNDATFHDSELLSFAFDVVRATAVFEFDIQCRASVPDEQFSLQRGKLKFSEVCFFWVEPAVCRLRPNGYMSLWITAEGPLPDKRLAISGTLPDDLPPDAFVHYLYSSSTNSIIVIGAKYAVFKWDVYV